MKRIVAIRKVRWCFLHVFIFFGSILFFVQLCLPARYGLHGSRCPWTGLTHLIVASESPGAHETRCGEPSEAVRRFLPVCHRVLPQGTRRAFIYTGRMQYAMRCMGRCGKGPLCSTFNAIYMCLDALALCFSFRLTRRVCWLPSFSVVSTILFVVEYIVTFWLVTEAIREKSCKCRCQTS